MADKVFSKLVLRDKDGVEETFVPAGGGGGGTSDYDDLDNKPQVNGTTLSGNVTTADLDLVSTDANNAIHSGEDGNLFVEDKTSDIETLETKVDRLNIAQKTVNKDLGYFFATYGTDGDETNKTITVTANTNLIPNLTNRKINDIEVSADGWVTLLGGHSYRIEADVMTSGAAQGRIYVIDKTGKMYHKYGYWNGKLATPNDTPAIVYMKPQEDIEVGFCVTLEAGNQLLSTFCSFEVQEIGRTLVIDPVEHVNETQGIEDTPVGHVMAYMGTDAPAHYLVADGSVYNIADYPYLAQWVIDNYETVNYFGGDGVTTFGIPNLMNKFLKGSTDVGVAEEAGLPAITGTAGTRGVVYGSNGTGALTGSNYTTEVANQGFGAGTYFKTAAGLGSFGIDLDASKSSEIYGKSETVTPENMSVLWCIKYEPTYFMQTTYAAGWNGELTQEHWTGEYFNGKPVYEITLTGTTSSSQDTQIDVSSLKIERMLSLDGVLNVSRQVSDAAIISIPAYNSASDRTFWFMVPSTNTLYIRTDGSMRREQAYNITIKYTKASA